jgi:hypothetical protein
MCAENNIVAHADFALWTHLESHNITHFGNNFCQFSQFFTHIIHFIAVIKYAVYIHLKN